MESSYDLRGFVYEDILEECKKFDNIKERLDYLYHIKNEWITKPPELDPNGELHPTFPEKIDLDIHKLEKKLEREKIDNQNKLTVDTKREKRAKIVCEKGCTADITRIFESMKKAEIIAESTRPTQIAEIFFEYSNEQNKFVEQYSNRAKEINETDSNSISTYLFNFVKHIIKISYDNRTAKLDELQEYIDKIRQKKFQ